MKYTSEVLQLKSYSDGVSMQFKYLSSDTKPEIVNNNVSEWRDEIPSLAEGEHLYMIQKKSNETNWSTPIQMSATDGTTPTISIAETGNGKYWQINGETTNVKAEGEPGHSPEVKIGSNGNWYIDGKDSGTQAQGPKGVDGDSIEYVYYRSTVEVTDLSAPSYTNGQLPVGWEPSPLGITEDYKFEYVSIRTKSAGSWSSFSKPVIWSKWGERGMDGDGVEYKYCLTDSTEKPIYPAPAGASYVWTDEPTGVSIEKRYEYVVSLVVSPVEAYAKKINTASREFPLEGERSWSFYGEKGHEENWTIRGGGNLDNSHIYLGDYAYVEGIVQNTTTPVKLYGKVIELYDSSIQDGYIRMRSSHLVVGNYSAPTSNVSLWASYSPSPLVGIRSLTYVADQPYRNTFSYSVTVYDPDLGESIEVASTATGGNVTKDLNREPKVGETYETNLKSGDILYRNLYKILYVGNDTTNGERDYVAKTLSTNRLTGEQGSQGDTIRVVYAYLAKGNATRPTTVPNGSTLNGWQLTPIDATVSNPYVFVCQCTVTNESYGTWSSPVVWAKFGKDGTDATVTPENVFNVLTSDATEFGCFYGDNGELYINAIYINTNNLTSDWILSTRVIAQNLDASTGHIAGWKIAENSITTENDGLGDVDSFHMYSSGYTTTDASSSNKYFGQTNNLTWCLGIGDRFGVTKSGQLFATDAYLTNVNAKSGYIGGWNISSYQIGNTAVGMYSGSLYKYDSLIPNNSQSSVRFYAGGTSTTQRDGKFMVLEDGSLYASAANITGTITAEKGWIGGIEIKDGGLGDKVRLNDYGLHIKNGWLTIGNENEVTMQGEDSVGGIWNSGSGRAVVIKTSGAMPFIIKNESGAGIRFQNAPENNQLKATLTTQVSGNYNGDHGGYDYGLRYSFSGGESAVTDIYFSYVFTLVYTGVGTSQVTVSFKIPAGSNNGQCGITGIGGPTADKRTWGWQEGWNYFQLPGKASKFNTYAIYSNLSNRQIATGTTVAYLQSKGESYELILNSQNNNILYSLGSFIPGSTGLYLGDSGKAWEAIYSKTGGVLVSDAREKNSIQSFSDSYESFYDKISPILYKLNDGTSGRLHSGFIAQEIERALSESNIDTKDFAGICIGKDENNTRGLRYEEFIALNTWQIQKLKLRVSALEQTILDYESRISKLETEIQNLKS